VSNASLWRKMRLEKNSFGKSGASFALAAVNFSLYGYRSTPIHFAIEF
jgi:hypothetical protein